MFNTPSISRTYNSFSDRIDEADWTREAGVISILVFAAWIGILYLWVFFGGGTELYTPGIKPLDIEGFVFLMPFPSILLGLGFYTVLRLLSPRLPGRGPVNALVTIWALLAPVPLAVLFTYAVYETSLSRGVEAIQQPDSVAFILFVFLAATVLTAFAGIAYAASTGLLSLSGRGRRRAILAIFVVIALPLGIGIAATAGEEVSTDNTYNESDYYDGVSYTGDFRTSPENGQFAPGNYEEDIGPLACTGDPPSKDEFRNGTWYEPKRINVSDDWLRTAELQHIELTGGKRVVHTQFWTYYVLRLDAPYRYTRMENWESSGVVSANTMSETHAASFDPGSNGPQIQMEQVRSMVVYQDFVTEDGEVVRYGTRLCRPDVEE